MRPRRSSLRFGGEKISMALEGDFASIDGDSRAVEKISMALGGDFASIDWDST
jgi:hypothetical protein